MKKIKAHKQKKLLFKKGGIFSQNSCYLNPIGIWFPIKTHNDLLVSLDFRPKKMIDNEVYDIVKYYRKGKK